MHIRWKRFHLDEMVKPLAEIVSWGELQTCLIVNDGQRQFCLLARKRVRCLNYMSVEPDAEPMLD